MPTRSPIMKHVSRDRIVADPFLKKEFFGNEGSNHLFFRDCFAKCVLPLVSSEVPAFSELLERHELTRNAQDYEIVRELPSPKLFLPNEFAAVVHFFLCNAEPPHLPRDHSAIFHVVCGLHVYSIDICYDREECRWNLHMDEDVHEGWSAGDLVFSRAKIGESLIGI